MRILLADDDLGLLVTLKNLIETHFPHFSVVALDNPVELIKTTQVDTFELAILDMSFGENFEDLGLLALKNLLKNDPKTRVIILTANKDKHLGWTAIKSGALFFVNKPFDLEHLIILLNEAAKQYELREYAEKFEAISNSEIFFGKSSLAQELNRQLLFCSKNDLPLLIVGETGTGKSHYARLVHSLHVKRKSGRFCVFQPGLVNEEMVYVELFGAKKGAYTGLNENKPGLVELADNGTLFIDEIAELPPNIQLMLLRVLNDKVVRRLGETEERVVNFRLISATNLDLNKAIELGKFREDLLNRIAGVVVKIPPLRERKEDIPELANSILQHLCRKSEVTDLRLSEDAINLLLTMELKGNIRELQILLERGLQYALFEGAAVISSKHLDSQSQKEVKFSSLNDMVDDYRRTIISSTLVECNWNISETARKLRIDRTQLRRLIQRYNIERK